MGKVPGESEMAPWASSNHCAMFEHGYLELIGITNPENFNPWSRFLDRFEGPHITALRCENGEEAYKALSGRIDHFDPPLQRLRTRPTVTACGSSASAIFSARTITTPKDDTSLLSTRPRK